MTIGNDDDKDELSFLMDEENLDLGLDEETSEGDEDEDGEGDKKSSGGGKDPYKVKPKEVKKLLEEEEIEESDGWKEKMRLLALGPFSSIIPGASAFDAESDLKKKMLIGEIGIFTNQIEPSDIANPLLVENLQARLNVRQEEMRVLASTMLQQAGLLSGITNAALTIGAEMRQDVKDIKFLSENILAKLQDDQGGIDSKDRALSAKREDVVKIEEEKPEAKKKNEFETTLTGIIDKNKGISDIDITDYLDNKRDDKFSVASQIESQDSRNFVHTQKVQTGEINLQNQFNQSATQTTPQTQAVPLKQEVNFGMNDPSAVLRPQMDQFKI